MASPPQTRAHATDVRAGVVGAEMHRHAESGVATDSYGYSLLVVVSDACQITGG